MLIVFKKGSFKKSTLKNTENLKFIPVNLHLEQLVVEQNYPQQSFNALSSLSDKKTYNFTSVGAFTTIHTNKPTNSISIDQLMVNDKHFKFKSKDLIDFMNDEETQSDPIENEIFLNFFSLKLFIEIGEELKFLKKACNQKEKV